MQDKIKGPLSPTSFIKTACKPRPNRTSMPSTIAGLGDVPVDVDRRNSFLEVTRQLVSVGAVPIGDAVESRKEYQRREADAVMKSGIGSRPPGVVEVYDGTSSGTRTDSSNGAEEADEFEEDAEKDEEEDELRESGNESEAIVEIGGEDEEILTRPSQYLVRFWRSNVSALHPPKFSLSLLSNSLPKVYGCTVTLYLPPSSTRTFTIPPSFVTKKEAKDAVSKEALMYGLCEEGRLARKRAGEEVQGEGEDDAVGLELEDNPVGVLTVAWSRAVPNGNLNLEWESEMDENDHTYGCTLTIPLPTPSPSPSHSLPSVHLEEKPNYAKVYRVPRKYESRKEAKVAVARVALKDDILPILDLAFQSRLIAETGAYIDFNAAAYNEEGVEVETDATLVLAKDWVRGGGNAKGLVYTTSRESSGTRLLHGAKLVVRFTPTHSKTFEVPPSFRRSRDARMAVACRALKNGVVDEIGRYKGTHGGKELHAELTALSASKKKYLPVPEAGSIAQEDLERMFNPGGYLTTCVTSWIKNASAPVFQYEMDKETLQFGAKLIVNIPSLGPQTYIVGKEHSQKRAAKDAVVLLAFKEGVLKLLKDAEGLSLALPAGGPPGRAGGDRDLRYSFRGDERRIGRGGGRGRRIPREKGIEERRSGRQQFDGRGGGPSLGDFHPRSFDEPRPDNGYASLRHHQLNGGNGQQYDPSTPRVFPPPRLGGFPLDEKGLLSNGPPHVNQLDDFCQKWMGTGRSPEYRIHRHAQNGLFGSVVRVLIAPNHIKSFWVDCDFSARFEAYEAVAKIAIDGGIMETIKKEFLR